ncbi:MAG: YccF domain-containing protein [bacterium]|nr:YccF domain-containing protein [bacterium]
MTLLLNLLWVTIGGGIFVFFGYLIGGFALCLTIIGIPAGVQCLKLALLAVTPFGKKVESGQTAQGFLSTGLNVVWIVTGGILLTITHIFFAFLMGITIIGLPFAKQHVKIASLALTPFGKAAV